MANKSSDLEKIAQLVQFGKYKTTRVFQRYVRLPHKVKGLFTGNQCLGSESEIFDPIANTFTRVDSIKSDFHVLAWDGEKLVPAKAMKPYKKSRDDLFRITLSDGSSFVASKRHRILSPSGFCMISEFSPGSVVFRPPSNSEFSPSVQHEDGLSSVYTSSGSQYGCQSSPCSNGEPLLPGEDTYQDAFPLQDDALEHKGQVFLHRGAPGYISSHSPVMSQSCHLSNRGDSHLPGGRVFGYLRHFLHTNDSPVYGLIRACRRPPNALDLRFRQVFVFLLSASKTLYYILRTEYSQLLSRLQVLLKSNALSFCQPLSTYEQGLMGCRHVPFVSASSLGSYKPPLDNCLTVTNVAFLRNDVKWDFGVPGYHNYFHEGIIHHNSMKTSATAFQYVMRILGTHPVPKFNVLYFECERRWHLFENTEDHEYYAYLKKIYLEDHNSNPIQLDSGTFSKKTRPENNICPECGSKVMIHPRKTRIYRFASETLPTEKGGMEGDSIQSAEVRNTQYPEFKKWCPPFLIKKDNITVRNSTLTLFDPNANKMFGNLKHIGADIMIEFSGYSQSVQAGAGVQRLGCWCDEVPPLDFYEEQFPRLLAEDGDMIMTVTPAIGVDYAYDDIFEKAKIIVRTPTICKYYLEEEGKVVKEIEHTDSNHDIAVIQAATDDNPTLSPDVVEAMYNEMPDLDGTAIATRRYGIFKQATGRIFKDMNYKVHVIDPRAYEIGPEYINGLVLARTFDFHPANPHAIIWAGLSPTDELFIYREWKPSPDKWVTSRLCRHMAKESGYEKYVCNLIDPLAKGSKQERDGQVFDTVELMNKDFLNLKRDGMGTGGYWEPFNTKGDVGRDAIKTRLRNSLKVERPFNNKITEDGRSKHIPTIWIFKDCRDVARSLKQWRLESWASNRQLATKDRKEMPAQKWSHFCTALEGLLKDKRFRPRRESLKPAQRSYKKFQGGRR